MITASGDPAAAIKLLISAAVRLVGSKGGLCELEADEIEEIAESMDEVRGMLRGKPRSPAWLAIEGAGKGTDAPKSC